jgi:elongator complex protein 3
MDAGKYDHYDLGDLMNLIMEVKDKVPEWIRLNRVVRDIPTHEIIDGVAIPNLRQILQKKMTEKGLRCKCIRCREVGSQKEALAMTKDAELVVREYKASGGTEYFISFESPCRTYIYGFCRLRLSPDAGYCRDISCPRDRKSTDVEKLVVVTHSLKNTAMIRELHVYGKVTPVHSTKREGSQHYGFGKRMMAEAERIAIEAGFKRIAVISGIGVREYYQKLGYHEQSTYMIKDFASSTPGIASSIPGIASSTPGLASSTPGIASSTPGLASSTPGITSSTPGIASSTPGLASSFTRFLKNSYCTLRDSLRKT